ncbi:Putative inner membrane protein [Salmonella enterica subsp. enterica]|uniref:Inner membrane protein n=1 Tax=Salmonella enterica I TaxID=59201 RepID=A0A447MZA9_SALET|nr:Putative inner membrane protein [Salmonella enterica subsp. enterica]
MFLIILIKSLIIGALVGVGVGAGAARMFHAPTTQGMGAFRTLGELNSCEGDPASHFSFGWVSSLTPGRRLWRPDRSPRMSITASSLTGARRR